VKKGADIFERFTDRARKIMALANQGAQKLNHPYIGTEHILLGLVVEGSGIGARVLKNLGTDADTVRVELEQIQKRVVPRDVGKSFLRVRASRAEVRWIGRSSARLARWRSLTWTGCST